MKVGFCRFPRDEEKKLQLLSDLKDAVAEFNLEFEDSHQKVCEFSSFNPNSMIQYDTIGQYSMIPYHNIPYDTTRLG